VYLVSPETAAAAALTGHITDPSSLCFTLPETRTFLSRDERDNIGMLIPPLAPEAAAVISIERGPNIKPCPSPRAAEDSMDLPVLLKAGDNITTDDIMPAGAMVLPFRSNIPEIAKFVFTRLDPGFWERARNAGSGLILGGTNYGQGSSREHATLAPMYLGIRAVLAKSFARIHKANLINFGILPLVFADPEDYDRIAQGDLLEFRGVHSFLEAGIGGEAVSLEVMNKTEGKTCALRLEADERDQRILLAGGLIPYTKLS
jgi:aconitate hydratase